MDLSRFDTMDNPSPNFRDETPRIFCPKCGNYFALAEGMGGVHPDIDRRIAELSRRHIDICQGDAAATLRFIQNEYATRMPFESGVIRHGKDCCCTGCVADRVQPQPGRDIDALVAREIFQWTVRQDTAVCGRSFITAELVTIDGPDYVWSRASEYYRITGDPTDLYPRAELLPRFSTSIADAWIIVDFARGHFSGIQWDFFCRELSADWKLLRGSASGDAPYFICVAAILAVKSRSNLL